MLLDVVGVRRPIAGPRRLLVFAFVLLSGCGPAPREAAAPATGPWRATLQTQGGELPFTFELAHGAEGWTAVVLNAGERLEIPSVEVRDDSLVLAFPHFATRIAARVGDDGGSLEGELSQVRSAELVRRVAFAARAGAAPRFAPDPGAGASTARAAGRWRIDFASEDIDAVGVIEDTEDGRLIGTFLTATGDYRYLEGRQDGDRFELSTFDGAHQFLFRATVTGDSLVGEFFSGMHWRDPFRGVRDAEAQLPDAFSQSAWRDEVTLADLQYPDLHGVPRSLDDPAFAGRARILYVFGTWCPNCADATALMVELYERHRDRGLAVLGLAFESTGDFARDGAQVRRYARQHGVPYPLLVAGLREKDQASAAFPLLDRVRSFPTTIFLHADGRVRAVHTGFSGPATGEAHLELRARFTELVEELLAEGGR